jgi:hypothetical protein
MNRAALAVLAITMACALVPAPADAASNRTFVSGLGNDGNACTLSAPCRTLQAAFNATAPGGEIQVLDPTGYGTLNITHAVNIEGHGWASLNANGSATVITIAAGAGDVITLNGLVIQGFAASVSGSFAIVFDSGGTLRVHDCVVRDTTQGILFAPITSSNLSISNTRIEHTLGTAILLQPRTANITVNAAIVDSLLAGNVQGVAISNSLMAAIATTVAVRNSTLTDNAEALLSIGTGAQILLAHSTVLNSTTALVPAQGGFIDSYGDNYIDGNGSNGALSNTIPRR